MDLRDVRREYRGTPLGPDDLAKDPITEFARWMTLAREYQPEDATCMVLATSSKTGLPAARTVLLKHFDESGFCWYTNLASDKARDLAENPQAALHFYWYSLFRQVRITGRVKELSRAEAQAYFKERPIGSRISALVSRQSRAIASREELESAAREAEQQYADKDIPCPQDWGGYLLLPGVIEFWQGRENRLHDRFQYSLVDGSWQMQRLQP